MAKLTVVVPDELLHAVRREALERRQSVSAAVRRFLEGYAGGALAAGETGAHSPPAVSTQNPSASVEDPPAPAASATKCSREARHHINHAGKPCPECGWPEGATL